VPATLKYQRLVQTSFFASFQLNVIHSNNREMLCIKLTRDLLHQKFAAFRPAFARASINSLVVSLPSAANCTPMARCLTYGATLATPLSLLKASVAFLAVASSFNSGTESASQPPYRMSAPIMCGVFSIAVATAWAGMAPSSNSSFAFFVFQSTLADRMPLTLASDASSVEGQASQCSPVTKNVAWVGSAGFALGSLFCWAAALATAPETSSTDKYDSCFIKHLLIMEF
jgi:hypothetical protein